MKKIVFFAALLLGLLPCLQLTGFGKGVNHVWAQPPAPAPAEVQPILISNVTAHLGDGNVIPNALIAVRDGKIEMISQINVGRDFPGYRVIEGDGQHLYPGFIAPNTTLGLTEIGMVRATNDYREVGEMNPNVRSLIAYNTDSDVLPTIRANGVLLAQVCPEGGVFSGTSSVVQLDAWNWEDAAVRADDGVHLHWPRRMSYNFRTHQVEEDKDYGKKLDELRRFMLEAQAYLQKESPAEKNLKFEALRGVFEGRQNLYLHATDAQSIMAGVLFAEDFGIRPVLVGGRDAYLLTDFLKEKDIPVILSTTFALPAYPEDDIAQPFKTPAILQEAGILFCFSQGGSWSWQDRNLGFVAGQAVAHGLPYEAAVQALTQNAALILGIEDRAGYLRVGGPATFFLSKGDALDMRTNQVTHAFIDGREIVLDDKQKALYRKFRGR